MEINSKSNFKNKIIKICIIVLILTLPILFVGCSQTETKSYLRIHIRANSNDKVDQDIKYVIKTDVVNFLTPLIVECNNFEEVKAIILNNLCNIENICDDSLKENNFEYKSSASINNEFFPTRNYGEYTLVQDYYDALIINLGEGVGDNWWCVVYPPLCFTTYSSTQSVVYKSKILEIIKKFFNDN